MKNFTIRRPANGILLNAEREYLYSKNATPLMAPDVCPVSFDSAEEAKQHVLKTFKMTEEEFNDSTIEIYDEKNQCVTNK